MPDERGTEAIARFEALRPRLTRVAYRMLGSVADAQDAVQDAYLRWHGLLHAGIEKPEAFLIRIVTRLCLDRLRAARRTRETYIGPWLPEPVFEAAPDEAGEDVSLVLMLALERLSPLERAAFLLHDVFGLGFEAISAALDREAAACRQLASRARRHVRAARPRFPVTPEAGARIAQAFFEASRRDDASGLQRLLAADVVAYTDGGGLRPAALNPILGRERVTAMFHGLARKIGFVRPPLLHRGWIDGLPGFVTVERGDVLQTTGLHVDEGVVRAIYIVRNPEKLRHLVATSEHST